MLLFACQEVVDEGAFPNFDVAVTVIASRIAFACSVESITPEAMEYFASVLEQDGSAKLELKPSIKQ
jgi:hypothetical protein